MPPTICYFISASHCEYWNISMATAPTYRQVAAASDASITSDFMLHQWVRGVYCRRSAFISLTLSQRLEPKIHQESSRNKLQLITGTKAEVPQRTFERFSKMNQQRFSKEPPNVSLRHRKLLWRTQAGRNHFYKVLQSEETENLLARRSLKNTEVFLQMFFKERYSWRAELISQLMDGQRRAAAVTSGLKWTGESNTWRTFTERFRSE